jgi:hypothetical protein
VSIPGTGDDANVYAHVQFLGANGLVAANDDDDQAGGANSGLNLSAVTLGNLAGPFARVAFCLDDAEAPSLDDFTCTVLDAATVAGGDPFPYPEVTCGLSLASP